MEIKMMMVIYLFFTILGILITEKIQQERS